jgi:hypothetical protein
MTFFINIGESGDTGNSYRLIMGQKRACGPDADLWTIKRAKGFYQ